MERQGWKIFAIILIVTNVLTLLLIISAASLGVEMIENELECSDEICFNMENAAMYFYDDMDNICQCMDYEGTVIYQEVME